MLCPLTVQYSAFFVLKSMYSFCNFSLINPGKKAGAKREYRFKFYDVSVTYGWRRFCFLEQDLDKLPHCALYIAISGNVGVGFAADADRF